MNFVEFAGQKGYSEQDLTRFNDALDFSKRYLEKEKRLSGDTFFVHNVRVAEILADSKVSPEVITASLLHGVLGFCKEDELKEFSGEVLSLVKGVEELKKLKSKNNKLEAEALKKILITTTKDVRVIFIKLASKLDNLRSVEVFPEKDRKRITKEVLEIYAPLANSLGLERIKNPLENISLQISNPQKYDEILNFLRSSREQREADVKEAIEIITKSIKEKVKILTIKGRSKHLYSIFKKFVDRKIPLNEQYDLSGVRMIVPEIKDCYTLLGLLHESFQPLDGRLKDYIANPKPNFYRSLHTSVKLPNGKIVEIQIRTAEMDEFAEEGFAAHWRYKGIKSDQHFEKKIGWLKSVLDMQKDENKDFLEVAKVDVFGDKIYCYTPKGDVKELPEGASLLDFAFLIHEEVGSKAIGGRVNGVFVPLRHKLNLGDVVEIVTNKNQRPRRDWIKIVRSARVKQKIRKSLREHESLPAFHYRYLKPVVEEEQGLLVVSKDFPKAVCMLAKCCHALPGENIVGIATKRRIISVHKEECRHALKEESRWVQVSWREYFNQKIGFILRAGERRGLLADLLNTIATAGFEVKEAKAKLIDLQNAECSFMIIPKDLENLKELIRRVRKVKGVQGIYFE